MEFDIFEDKTHDLNELLDIIIDRVSQFTKSERVLIYLYDDADQVLWNRAGTGADFMSLEFPLGKGVPGHVIENLKSIIINDASSDTRYDIAIDDVTDVTVKSILCSPITDPDHKKIGVVQVINKTEGDFTERDQAFVEAMAAQAAIGIDNTVLFTKLQAIREREKALAEEIKIQNEKLQEAYLKIEAENKETKESSEKVGRNRMIAVVAGIALFMIAGIVAWQATKIDTPSDEELTDEVIQTFSAETGGRQTFTVETKPLSFPLTLAGSLEPVDVENLFAPFPGTITEKNYDVGDFVDKGQVLLKLDTDRVESTYRNAKIAEINARREYLKIKDWENSKEVAEARRFLLRAEEEVEISTKLFDIGIYSEDQKERALDALRSAESRIESVTRQGDPQNVKIAQFKWLNALNAERSLKEKLDGGVVKAPISGVIIQPPTNRGQRRVNVEPGVDIDDGALLVSIANLESLTVLGRVSETDISTVRVDQEVEITGDAFPGVVIQGKVVYVSSQASRAGRGAIFAIKVETLPLSVEQRKRVRLGMTATLSIVTYENPEAILIPFEVVQITQNGNFVFKVKEGSEQPERVAIETGISTPSAVEVVDGVETGDELLIIN